ncbi:TPA: hypothetical protein ACTW8S_000508 [Klebsiella variicola subsp. variicola]
MKKTLIANVLFVSCIIFQAVTPTSSHAESTTSSIENKSEQKNVLSRKADKEIVVSMTVDVDGAPNAYGPDNKKALDYKQDANHKDSRTVVGYLIDKNGNPFIQGEKDPAPGFYISVTRYVDVKNKNDLDPRKYVNAAEKNYTVLASSAAAKGVKYGDFCVVHSVKTNKTVFAIVGDSGNSKGAEGSLALLQHLGYNAKDGKSVPENSGIVVRYFANSNPSKQFFFNQADLDKTAKMLNLDTDFSNFH